MSRAWLEGAGDLIHDRIAHVAGKLTNWAAETFGNIKKRVKDAEVR